MALMAICDARYVFTLADVGSYGSNNESGIFRKSPMRKAFFNQKMNIPNPDYMSFSQSFGILPFFLVGEEGFPFQDWLMRTYVGQGIPEDEGIFNYRLSRARRVIENAFGILAARLRILMPPV